MSKRTTTARNSNKNFCLSSENMKELGRLCKYFDENPSQVMRRLIMTADLELGLKPRSGYSMKGKKKT